MTMNSLVVSVTFVVLTVAANQLGPRLIPTFMADRQIQLMLGLFLGTILYVLVVLRTLDEGLGPKGIPHIAVTVGSFPGREANITRIIAWRRPHLAQWCALPRFAGSIVSSPT